MSTTPNQKKRRAERTKTLLSELINRYPHCFTADKAAIRPLAIGIQESILADLQQGSDLAETPRWLIKQALSRYTRQPAYLAAISEGHHRIGLDGADMGPVTENAKEHAESQRVAHKTRSDERRRDRKPPQRREIQQRKLDRLAERFNH